jgi:hypothetical protein
MSALGREFCLSQWQRVAEFAHSRGHTSVKELISGKVNIIEQEKKVGRILEGCCWKRPQFE